MLVSLLGWISTALVLLGFLANAVSHRALAIIIWVIGDLGWIAYDILISNPSHMFLSIVIILINIFAFIKIWKS